MISLGHHHDTHNYIAKIDRVVSQCKKVEELG